MRKLSSVLIIDDDPITNFINKKLLEKMAVTDHVLSAVNGETAINMLKQQSASAPFPELILLDINMPVMGGVEFLQSYRQLGFAKEATKVIVLTTSDHPRDLECLKGLPTNDYLTKPLTTAKMLHVLARYFESDGTSGAEGEASSVS